MRILLLLLFSALPVVAEPLANTKPLVDKDDLALKMVAGIDTYLQRELQGAAVKRAKLWKPDRSSVEAFQKSLKPQRDRLRQLLGMVDAPVPAALEYVGTPDQPGLVASTDRYKVYAVRWAVLAGVDAEGLLLEPNAKVAQANVVCLPDADNTPEQLVGLAAGIEPKAQAARLLAEHGCRVLVPVLIDRQDSLSGSAKFNRWTNQPHREFIYRMAYEMGRHILGYEVQKVEAAVSWFLRKKDDTRVVVWGQGEGGVIAALSAAVDPRIEYIVQTQIVLPDAQPLYRNVWAYQAEFGDEGLRTLCLDRVRIVEHSLHPKITHPAVRMGRGGAAPLGGVTGLQTQFSLEENDQNKNNVGGGHYTGTGAPEGTLASFLALLKIPETKSGPLPKDTRIDFNPAARHQRQFEQLVAFTQKVWRDSESVRMARFKNVDFSNPAMYEASIQPIRQYFDKDVIGQLPAASLPMNPKSRELYDTPKWKGYEVTLDLHPDVFAYGILLLPKDMKPGEKRPVVVCQHGLEGRPTDVCNPKERTKYYNSFGAQLADRGYIVYAPQNPYIGQDKFRVLQRKANPLKLSLFSFIVRQHEVTLAWLKTLPNVDPAKLAFYGLSYGGKTAMRVPAILPDYCLSICSGDFNEWVGKNVSVDYRGSYMFTMEYEMPEFDLGSTFNYAEMAYLIAPRPFMVERGHDDGVGIDEMVAYEYAKVRYWYANRLKLGDRQELEFFLGGHEIQGKGTFAFLQKHLGYPK